MELNAGNSESLAVTDDNLNVVHVRMGRPDLVWRVTRTSLTNLIEPTTVFDVPSDGGYLMQVATSNTCTSINIGGESVGKNRLG